MGPPRLGGRGPAGHPSRGRYRPPGHGGESGAEVLHVIAAAGSPEVPPGAPGRSVEDVDSTPRRRPFAGRGRTDDVHRITGARRGLTEDIDSRARRYLITMGIRTACFVLAVAFDGWLRWVFLVGAVFLPYFAVVIANAGRESAPGAVPPVPFDRVALPSGRQPSEP